MNATETLKVSAWSLTVIYTAMVTGLGWLAEPVTMPLGAVLALTFVPLGTIQREIRTRITGDNYHGTNDTPRRE